MPNIKQTAVFKFSELSDAAKQKAMGWYREASSQDDYFSECVIDDAKTIGELFGLDIANIYWSGFSHQGQGACFEATYCYKKGGLAAVKSHAPCDTELHAIVASLQDIQRRNFYRLHASTENTRGMNMRVSVEDCESRYRDLQGADNAVESELESFAHWIYKRLESEYEYQNSDEMVSESIEINGYEFDSEGNRA